MATPENILTIFELRVIEELIKSSDYVVMCKYSKLHKFTDGAIVNTPLGCQSKVNATCVSYGGDNQKDRVPDEILKIPATMVKSLYKKGLFWQTPFYGWTTKPNKYSTYHNYVIYTLNSLNFHKFEQLATLSANIACGVGVKI
jgi:hypothetical protein